MTPKSLYIIILRIVGLLILVQGIIELPRIIQEIIQSIQEIQELFNDKDSYGVVVVLVILYILTVVIYVLLLKYLLLKPEIIIGKLKLDKNFDEEKFELNIHSSTVIRIAIIVIGGMTFIDHFIPLLRNIYVYMDTRNNVGFAGLLGGNNVSELDLIVGGLTLLISYLLISNSRRLTNWIEHIRRK